MGSNKGQDSHEWTAAVLLALFLVAGTAFGCGGSRGGPQIGGSDFVSGTQATLGGQVVSCTVDGAESMSCAVPSLPAGGEPLVLTNPDGETFTVENAFTLH